MTELQHDTTLEELKGNPDFFIEQSLKAASELAEKLTTGGVKIGPEFDDRPSNRLVETALRGIATLQDRAAPERRIRADLPGDLTPEESGLMKKIGSLHDQSLGPRR